MRHLTIISFSLCLLLSIFSAAADDDPQTLFPVEERCLPDPILPPDDWAYDGMILMEGYAGIHGVQMNWETPRVVAFLRGDVYNEPLVGGQLSPDGLWYAVPIGETFTEVSYNQYWFVHGVRVYSTSGVGEPLEFDLSDYSDLYAYSTGAWSYLPIQWRDNTSFVIGGLVIYPFDGTVEAAEFNFADSVLAERYVSPDVTRLITSALFELPDRETALATLGGIYGASWRRDSSAFILAQRDEAQSWNGLALYDRDGEFIERVFDLGDGTANFNRDVLDRNDGFWSPHGERFAFVRHGAYPEPNRLHIIDWEQQVVIDTCVTPLTQPVWSPDGTMLAYLVNARQNLKVIVVDTETWQVYDVARHSGRGGVFWQAGMVGWREAAG